MDQRPWHRHYDTGVPTSLDYPDVRLDQLLASTAEKYPNKSAIVFMGNTMAYAELDRLVDRMAAALQQHAFAGACGDGGVPNRFPREPLRQCRAARSLRRRYGGWRRRRRGAYRRHLRSPAPK